MVHGYHVIFGTYGFWLPNDPRGSWSDFAASWELVRFGKATKVSTRRSVAAVAHDRQARLAAKQSLKYPPVVLTGEQALAAANGFAEACRKSGFTIWACAILPEHVHLVIARHRFKVEQVTNLLNGEATKRLTRDGLHPLARFARNGQSPPTPWSASRWKVFLNNPADIRRAIRYVEANPLREHKRRQRWPFVTPFQGLNAPHQS
ncbi:MAG: transposase [Planctomycetes bacterium]|nr:transposase [Planctomycetota bacterium]